MKSKFKEITEGLRSSAKDNLGPGLSRYKNLLQSNPRGAMIGLGVSAGYGLVSDGPNPVESTIMLAPALMGVGAALQAGGGVGAMKGQASQAAAAIRLAGKSTTGGNTAFKARTVIPTNYSEQVESILGGVKGTVPMEMQYSAMAAEMHVAKLGDSLTIGKLSETKDFGGLGGRYTSTASILARAKESPEFAEQFAKRSGDFRGVTGITSMPHQAEEYAATYMGRGREHLRSLLTEQGHGKLADELKLIDDSVRIKGIGTEGTGVVSAIEYQMGGRTFRTPVVNADGTFQSGQFRKNLNVARKQVFLGSLEGIAVNGKAQILATDIAVAKTISHYWGAVTDPANVGGVGMLADYLGDMANVAIRGLDRGWDVHQGMGSALAWTNPYRADRTGKLSPGNVKVRAMDVQVSAPKQALMSMMNLGRFFDRDALTSETILNMRRAGYAPFGSENQMRSLTFGNINEMAEMFPGSSLTPVDKSFRGVRDYAKPYSITSSVPGALKGFQRAPFASAKRISELGTKQGIVGHYNMVFESEVNLISEIVNTGRANNKGMNAAISHRIEAAIGGDMGRADMDDMREGLKAIAGMREGIFATTMPSYAKMTTAKEAVSYTLPEGLKIGQTLRDTAFGFDASNKPIKHSFSRFGSGGTPKAEAILTNIRSIKEGSKTAYLLEWSEKQAADTVKFGSDVGKMFAKHMTEKQAAAAMQFINSLRSNASSQTAMGKKLYGNQAFVPLMGQGVSGATKAFTLAETFGKIQGGHTVLASSLNEIYRPQMSTWGKGQITRTFNKHGLKVVGGNIVSTQNSPEQIEATYESLRGLAQRIYEKPKSFGLAADMFAGSHGGKITAEAALLMRGGIVSEMLAWDATNLNVPKRVAINTSQLSIMNDYGMSRSVTEMMGRREMRGNAEMTQAFKIGLGEYLGPRGKMKSNQPVIGLSRWDTSMGAAEWRKGAKVQDNFMIDLYMEGKGNMTARDLTKMLGLKDSRIPVPGVGTDFWRETYKTSTGSYASGESWAPALQRLLRDVEAIHDGDMNRVKSARHNYAEYLKNLRMTDANLSVGRGGVIYDAGPSIAGRMTFRDYENIYKGDKVLGGRASKFIVGMNPYDYNRLTEGSGAAYTEGLFGRHPHTTIDPVFYIPDEEVARGELASSEYRRALQAADHDGDTGYANLLKDEGSRKEVRDVVRGNTPLASLYDEAYGARALLGGVGDDIGILGDASNISGKSRFTNIAEKVTDRLGKFVSVHNQTEGTLLAKSYTQYIGRFSNLANEYIMASTSLNSPAHRVRAQLLRDIQQASIDFGRKSRGRINPGEIAALLADALDKARAGHIDVANENFAAVMRKLGVGKLDDVKDNLRTMEYVHKGDAAYLERLKIWASEIESGRTGFFDPLIGDDALQQEFGERASAQNLFNKRHYDVPGEQYGSLEEVDNAKKGLAAHLEGQTTAARSGTPSIGGASASAEALTGWNKLTAKAAGTKHILGGVMRSLEQSPHYKSVRGGAIATLGLMGANALFRSPTEMRAPDYDGRQKQMQQSPDVGMAGMNGAPMPGVGGGHAHRGGEMRSPRRVSRPSPPQNTIPHRYYVNQTNRVPRVRYTASGSANAGNQDAVEMGRHMQRMGGGATSVNITHDATSRRLSEHEFQDKMRDDLRGGR